MQVWTDADDALQFRVKCTEVVPKGLKEGQEFVVLSTIELPTRNAPHSFKRNSTKSKNMLILEGILGGVFYLFCFLQNNYFIES